MKKVLLAIGAVLMCLFGFGLNASAASTTYVDLENLNLVEYSNLEAFLQDYNSGNLPSIFVTPFLYDGVAAVKSPDLDDTEFKTLEIKVINIAAAGNYQFTGEITGAMIAVNTNGVSGEINIILNGIKLDTDSKKAPAIYVYNKDKNYTDCKVTIKTLANTKNYLEGGKLKKVSLLGSENLSDYASHYSGDALTTYNERTDYYGIYTSDQIKNILFATVQADNEDLQDGDPYYFYKASGAVSSDIDLYFEGEGYLSVTSKNKEGIETKGNLTFDGGTGDYEVYAQDDCLNTTTANANGVTVRNDITINVSSLLAQVSEEADEGDAIDSNGKLIINGGKIWAYAHPTSGDAGLDSINGTYINGGTVIATGNMLDPISNESKQNFISAQLNSQIKSGATITIKDQNDEVIAEFTTDRSMKTLIYSSADLENESYKIYADGEEISYSAQSMNMMGDKQKSSISGTLFVVWIIEIAALALFIAALCVAKYIKK
ncbi:carbohydrate-binding domain-containing protein [Candidatus Saccharibacteria bacterium]|nr:carbohydrate-binding domain-containing protein [Candidatus Saccharibacteria bacterium]